MKKHILLLITALFFILIPSANAISVSFASDVHSSVIHCIASNTGCTEYKWDWKHVDDTEYGTTDWIAVADSSVMDFTCIYKGRHIVILWGRNGSETTYCQKGFDIRHGKIKQETPVETIRVAEETGITSPVTFGEETINWIENIAYSDIIIACLMLLTVLVFFMMIKKKNKRS